MGKMEINRVLKLYYKLSDIIRANIIIKLITFFFFFFCNRELGVLYREYLLVALSIYIYLDSL